MSRRFVALDVETANYDQSSICQIGLARYDGDRLLGTVETLIDPRQEFDDFCVSIHGITAADVRGKPTWADVLPMICDFVGADVVVSHMPFDRTATSYACIEANEEPPDWTWLDSARVARRTWPEVARSGYGLASVCSIIGYEFRHHDALEDAKAAGAIIVAAMRLTGLDIPGWLARVELSIAGKPYHERYKNRKRETWPFPPPPTTDPALSGALSGETVVFTGTFAWGMSRSSVASIAASCGARVDNTVTARTTLLVVGEQSERVGRSLKEIRAAELQARGQKIVIISDEEFAVRFGILALL